MAELEKTFPGSESFFFQTLVPDPQETLQYSNSVPAKHIEQSLLVAHGPSPLEAVSGPLLEASLDTFLTKDIEGPIFWWCVLPALFPTVSRPTN